MQTSSARLWRADLMGASLWQVNPSEADLKMANLTQEQLEDTTGDEHTQLPPDLKPPAHWGRKADEQSEED